MQTILMRDACRPGRCWLVVVRVRIGAMSAAGEFEKSPQPPETSGHT